jgi:hypothetical protein
VITLDKGSPTQHGGATTETAKARQLWTGALRRCSNIAGPGSGPRRSERQFYARACGDGRMPPRSANRHTTCGGLAADRRASHVRFIRFSEIPKNRFSRKKNRWTMKKNLENLEQLL